MSSSTAAEQLPQELWALILQHVDYRQRLSACALVCRKLARAAAVATQFLDLDFEEDHPTQHGAFLSWTNSYGSSLTQLEFASRPRHTPVRQLACPNLLELELFRISVQLCASSEHLGLLHSCTALTSLSLLCVNLLDGGLEGLAGAAPAGTARLQHVTFDTVECANTQVLKTRLFPHLTSLTCLDVDGVENVLLACFPPHISTLASLQKLRLSRAGPITAAILPGIERLTALEDLSVEDCDLHPSCLLPMTAGLTRLNIENVTLRPIQAQQDGDLGASQLLQLLARLTALRELSLAQIGGSWPQQASAYSALTASSNLQELWVNAFQLQRAAWAHVFPAGRKLSQLRALSARVDGGSGRAPFDRADITRLVSCCPEMKDLRIDLCARVSLAPLQTLTALTSLTVGPVSPAAIHSDLAALTQLQSLAISVSLPADSDGEDAPCGLQHLVPLTALTGLTELRSSGCWVSSKPRAGSPPDVWMQMLQKCAADPAAQPAVISSVVLQLQQHQGQLAAVRTEAAAEAAELRGQLEAAVAEAAELRGRVQSLEGQLQEVLAALRR